MKICFVCNEYPPGPHGGIGTATLLHARAMQAAGHQVRVIGVYPTDYSAPDEQDDQGVQVRRLRSSRSRWNWLGARYQLWKHIAQLADKREIDIVELPDWEGWAAGWPRLNVPVIVRLNGSASYFAKELDRPLKTSTYQLERRSLKRADAWCSVSQYTADRTREVFGLRSEPGAILYNPVELPTDEVRGSQSQTDIVYSGTLTEKKGVISLMKAWRRVHGICPDARLHVFGKDGRTGSGRSMRERLQQELNGTGDSVQFHGHVSRDELFEHLERARAAVFPSYAEAFALAPLEAMVRGCPTVYSLRGSGPELIEPGRDGLLIDPDDVDGIADALIQLLQSDELAKRLGANGAERIRNHFTIDALLPRNERFFEECIDTFQSRRTSGKPWRRSRTRRSRQMVGHETV